MKFLLYLSFFPGFLVALTVHEAAHALVSKWLGDGYAQKQGRISLNPMRHLSALGTLMLFFAGFGWGKPVPVNLYNYKHPKFYYLLSSLAGPASNIVLCLISIAMAFGLNYICQTESGRTELSQVGYMIYAILWFFFYSLLYINVVLAVINLIPIPPLDGSKIWPCLIPQMRPTHSGKIMWLWIIVVIVMLRGDGIGKVIDPVIDMAYRVMPTMLHQQTPMPAGLPFEAHPPKDAHNIFYDINKAENGEPNVFTVFFTMDKPYPAAEYRSQLVESMNKLGWSKQNHVDPNKWEVNNIIDEDGSYKELTWLGIWKKENHKFSAQIQYYMDPNTQDIDKSVYVEYKYIFTNPVNTK